METYLIERGYLLLYRLFDIADSIDLERIPPLLQQSNSRRLHFRRFPKTQLLISVPPLSFDLGEQVIEEGIEHLRFASSIRIFDFGVVSVSFRIPFPDRYTFDSLVAFNHFWMEHPQIEQRAKQLAQEVFNILLPCLTKPIFSGFVEDYSIVYIEKMQEEVNLEELVHSPTLARLVLNEPSPLRQISKEALLDAVQFHFSYYADELTVIDWNAAFIYDPLADTDICDLIEFANAQLLELRSYDALLDRELERIYQEVSSAKGMARKRRYQQLSRRLLQVVLETTELSEKIDHALKWMRDVYLARVYQAATKQFNVPHWQAQVERKISLISRISELLTDRINTERSIWLETSILILILIEIILALIRK